MGWVYQKQKQPTPHQCPFPHLSERVNDGGWGSRYLYEIGDLWRCDDCGVLWVIDITQGAGWHRQWQRANWRLRLKHPAHKDPEQEQPAVEESK